MLETHDVTSLLTPDQLARLDAGARVAERNPLALRPCGDSLRAGNLADLEHAVLREVMLGSEVCRLPCVNVWWRDHATLSGEVQRTTRFRKQEPSDAYVWLPDEDGDSCTFSRLERGQEPTSQQGLCTPLNISIHENVSFLEERGYLSLLRWLAEEKELSLRECAFRFGRVDLPRRDADRGWFYHPQLGFFKRD